MEKRTFWPGRDLLWWVAMGAAIVIAGGSSASANEAKQWRAPERATHTPNPLPTTQKIMMAGKRVYEHACLACHGKTGRGDGPIARNLEPPPPDLTDGDRMKAQTDGGLFWKITEGRGAMPSYKKKLTEEERWQVVQYVRILVAPTQ